MVAAPNRRQLTPEHRMKSRSEMVALFADLPEASAASVEPAGIETGKFLAPHGIALDSKGDIYVGEVGVTNWKTSFPDTEMPPEVRVVLAVLESPLADTVRLTVTLPGAVGSRVAVDAVVELVKLAMVLPAVIGRLLRPVHEPWLSLTVIVPMFSARPLGDLTCTA